MRKPSLGKLSLFGLFLTSGLFLSISAVVVCDRHIQRATLSLHSTDPDDLPKCRVVLVLGCAETLPNGRTNRYFTARIEAAALLFRAGKCHAFIVSGDNGREDYDEPTRMTEALMKTGIPASVIYQDYAGFRTLDSIVRAKRIFGQSEMLVVSQRFHNERAIYIGLQQGITLYGLDAADVDLRGGLKTQIREKGARIKTILDLHLLHTPPRFLGPPIVIREI